MGHAVSRPRLRSVPVAATGTLDAQGVALNEIGRRAIMADPDWRGGAYAARGGLPDQGALRSRAWSAWSPITPKKAWISDSAAISATRPILYPAFGPTFDVEGYLHYHGEALAQRFDPNSDLYLTRAMDLYDLGRNGGEN